MQGDTGNGLVVNLEQEIIFQQFLDCFFTASDQPLFDHGFTGKPVDAGGIFLFAGRIWRYSLAYTSVPIPSLENTSQKAFSDKAIDQMYTWHPADRLQRRGVLGAVVFGIRPGSSARVASKSVERI